MTQKDDVLTTLRLPKEILERAEILVPELKRHPELALTRLSRSLVLRLALMEGIEALEEKYLEEAGRKK